MTAGEGACDGLRLKAKEKVLLQLCAYRSEPDDPVFPFEVTQKGLSDHLGLRRSHVAVALQDLVKDGSVEVAKGHVEGAERRLNAYCITPKGLQSGTEIRSRFFESEVPFEDSAGRRSVKVSEIVDSRKASLASVISQLEMGGVVRDEIAIMTKPEKRMISVFCPTCMKQIEVDNVFRDEEVGFDCPGCGRPYRIVPALKREEPVAAAERSLLPERGRSDAGLAVMLFVVVAAALAVFGQSLCLTGIILSAAAIGFLFLLISRRQGTHAARVRRRSKTGAVALVLGLGGVLVLMWHLLVASIELPETIWAIAPFWVIAAAGYFAMARMLPEFVPDYLVTSGMLFVLVGATLMFIVDLGSLDVSVAPFLGTTGAVLIVLSTFREIDRDAVILDCALASGVLLMLLAGIAPSLIGGDAIDLVASVSVGLLGAVLASLRVFRETTGSKDLSGHLLATLPLAAAAGLLVVGVLLVTGGAMTVGLIDLAVAVPLAYLGLGRAFKEGWTKRLPLLLLFVAVETLVIIAGLAR